MLKKIKDILNIDSKFYVIGISNNEGESNYTLLTIQLKNEDLKIEDRHTSNAIDDSFLDKLAKDYPVLLYIEGDNVINKVVDNTVGYRNNLIFKANQDDFYFFEYHQETKVYASVCRKSNIDVHIDAIKSLNLFVFHIAFGPFVMVNLLPLIKEASSIQSRVYSLDISEDSIVDFNNKTANNNRFTINDETFKEEEIPLLATFLNYKYPKNVIDGDVPNFNINKTEFKFKKGYKIAGIFTLAFIMSLLFGSHYLNEYYQEQLKQKRVSYNSSQAMTADINKLKEEVVLKEKILLDNRINNKNFITKYISEISNSVPEDITLKTIFVFPETKKIRENEKIYLLSNTIIIEGESLSDDSFNSWIKKIKRFKWINGLEIKYNQSDKKNNIFKIETKI